MGYFTWRPIYIRDNISLNSPPNEKIFGKKLQKKNENTNFMFNNFSENRAVYDIMYKNMLQPDRP
jgi:hypothetical protein